MWSGEYSGISLRSLNLFFTFIYSLNHNLLFFIQGEQNDHTDVAVKMYDYTGGIRFEIRAVVLAYIIHGFSQYHSVDLNKQASSIWPLLLPSNFFQVISSKLILPST